MKQQKSRTKRKLYIKTPWNVTTLHYRRRKPKKLRCYECGQELHGIPHLIKSKFRNLPKTKKRPQRPYGGVLCSKCTRKKIIEGVRKNV